MQAAAISANDSLAVDVTGMQALQARASGGDKSALRAAAQQFESLMIGMMLKTMRETKFSDDDDPMNSGEGTKLYRDLLDQQWADKLSKGHGLGFADMIVKSMEKYAPPASVSSTATGTGLPTTSPVVPPPSGSNTPPVSPSGAYGTTPKASTPASSRKRAFIESLRPQAEAAAAATGVPADFILAHAALESGWGSREITGGDGSASHNLFGIKAGGDWQGASVATLTTEYRQGVPVKVEQRFRAYADYTTAFKDYAGLLKARYPAALTGSDPASFAGGLAAGGYASDPAYAGKLQSVIASVATAQA